MTEVADSAPGAAHEAAREGSYDAGEAIFHHIGDSRTLELPLVGEVRLRSWRAG